MEQGLASSFIPSNKYGSGQGNTNTSHYNGAGKCKKCKKGAKSCKHKK